jgi:hypothetical protein
MCCNSGVLRGFVLFSACLPLFAADATLSGRVIDAATGELIPCTVTIRDARGQVLEDHASFRGGFRSNGTFRKAVAPGRTTVAISRGFDYIPEKVNLTLADGESRVLEVSLHRRSPLRQEGWYTGDNHIHMVHGERRIDVDFEYIALAGRAEGLDYASVAQHWNLADPTPERLAEACQKVSSKDFTLTWNLEAPKNYWRGDAGKCIGHGWTLGMQGRTADGRDAIRELLEMSAWDYESEKPPVPNFEIQAFIRSLGGIVSYTHPHRWWIGKWGGTGIYPVDERKRISNMAVELPFDTVIGPTYDTIDIMMQPHERETNRKALALWFMLLNRGYRIAATASSDTTFDNPGGGVPGKVRVYTQVDGSPTIAKIAASMKAGRNFVTSGPLLKLEIGGHGIGSVLKPGTPMKAVVRAWSESVSKLELIRNGEVVRTWNGEGGEHDVNESGPAWYVARCYGADETQVAITNPIYFAGPQPEPSMANVTATIQDENGTPLSGAIEIVRMDGRNAVVESATKFSGGRYEGRLKPAVRLRAVVPGYEPQLKSIFMDFDPLLQLTLTMNAEQLSTWSTYEQIRRLLDDVRLEFKLKRSARPTRSRP